jgi:hypothetical protein
VARGEELPKPLEVVRLEGLDGSLHSFVLRLHVPDAPRIAGFELAPPVGVARRFV